MTRALRHPLAAILLLAAILRIAVTIGASVHHPDEVFQYLEQAHRLVFGYGVVPWEYKEGMRSWLAPIALAGPMWLGDRAAPATLAYLVLPRLAVALSTLGIVWGAWSLGSRTSLRHAMLGAFVAAIWFEQVYFAAHTLTETMATAAAIPGIALLQSDRRRGLVAAGALLALAAMVRFHYLPVLAMLVIWRCRLDWRAWASVIAGGIPVLALSAAVDVTMDMPPFGWILANFQRNVVDNVSATYGVAGPMFYLTEIGRSWSLAFVPIAFVAFLRSGRYPQLLAAAVLTIALHTLIGHKEPRFILLATTLIVLLAAFGTANLIAMAAPERQRLWTGVALAIWAATSLALSFTAYNRPMWANEAPAITAARLAGQDPKLCGMATYDMRFWQSGGFTWLHRDVPLYVLSAQDEITTPPMDPATLARIAPGFDAIVTTPKGIRDLPRDYRQVACEVPKRYLATPAERTARRICLYRRPGPCDPFVANPWRLR